jgi:peptide/nickel transport system substrate-binding protein
VSRLDPSRNAITATVTVGREPAALATDGDAVLVADGSDGAVYRIGGGTTSPRRIAVIGAVPAALAETANDTLLTTDDLPSSHRGGTFVMADQEDFILTDPAMDSSNPTTWVWDSLVRYRRVAGSAGFDLVPDLATSIPQPTDGGRTYVFHVRPGIRYSTGGVVRPSDFARALRRIMQGVWQLPDQLSGSFLRFSLHSLDGVSGCVEDPPRAPCDPSRAITADDAAGTVTYHLAQPDSDFLHALAGTGVPVPPGAPMRASTSTRVPGTGPYMITVNDKHHALYVRNPYFHVWSADARPDGNVDRIDWLKDVSSTERPGDTTDAIALVEAGRADSAYKVLSPADTERVLRLYPSRVHLTPYPGGLEIGYEFRLDRPPFASADVRRALNLAIDRSRIAQATPQYSRPACRTIGAGIPGYLPTCAYTADQQPGGPPVIARARALVRRAQAVGEVVHMASWTKIDAARDPASAYKPWDDEVIAALRAIGLRVDVRRFVPSERDTFSQYDGDLFMHFGTGEGGEDGRDAIADITEGCPAHLDPGAFCDPTTHRLWARAVSLPDGADKVRALTAVDDHLTAEAAWLPVVTTINVVFLSKRAGNYGYQPATGGSLWDRMTVR